LTLKVRVVNKDEVCLKYLERIVDIQEFEPGVTLARYSRYLLGIRKRQTSGNYQGCPMIWYLTLELVLKET
jgi:hypothetical protein